ncbi:MAG: hypothetical protein ACI837_000035 [Crocinitomicaceae bacterium]|jgi:hypothetical protein
MLDFYLIRGEQSTPEDPEEMGLEFVGGLDLDVYDRLQQKDIIDNTYSFFSDFRWNASVIDEIYKRATHERFRSDTDAHKIVGLIGQARLKNSGLFATCD